MNQQSNVLLVEGRDDFHVISSLLAFHHVPVTFKIESKEGLSNILRVLPIQIKGSGVTRVGLVVDADADLAAIWLRIVAILRISGYSDAPPMPAPDGTILSAPSRPTVGIWVMPDNKLSGMLEDFVKILIPETDNLLSYVDAAIASVPEAERRYASAHAAKAFIHTWLAWQSEPGTPMGQAITKKYLNPAAPHGAAFVNWITRCFL
jgi:hypothetical protein